jgi:hypothetical protein
MRNKIVPEFVSVGEVLCQDSGSKIQRKFMVPMYQRDYDWNRGHVKTLVSDILDGFPAGWQGLAQDEIWDASRDSTYHLGSLVVIEKPCQDRFSDPFTKARYYEVLDGQQRLTALFMILDTLKDIVNPELPILIKEGEAKEGEAVTAKLTSENLLNSFGYQCRLGANKALEDMASGKWMTDGSGDMPSRNADNVVAGEDYDVTDTDNVVIDSGNDVIYGRLKESYNETVAEIRALLMGEPALTEDGIDTSRRYLAKARALMLRVLANVKFLLVELDSDTDSNLFFEIMNSRGETLEQSDIVKFWLVSKLDRGAQSGFNKVWQICSTMDQAVSVALNGPRTERPLKKLVSLIDSDISKGEEFEEFKAIISGGEGAVIADSKVLRPVIKDAILRYSRNGEVAGLQNPESDDGREPAKGTRKPFMSFPDLLMQTLALYSSINELKPGYGLDRKKLAVTFKDYGFDKDYDAGAEDWIYRFLYFMLRSRHLLDQFMIDRPKKVYVNDVSSKAGKAQVTEDRVAYEDMPDADVNEGSWLLRFLPARGGKSGDSGTGGHQNDGSDNADKRLRLILSMFHATWDGVQERHWLQAILRWLWKNARDIKGRDAPASFAAEYLVFAEKLADRFLYRYIGTGGDTSGGLMGFVDSLSEEFLKDGGAWSFHGLKPASAEGLTKLTYGGIHVFVFNYLDYKLYKMLSGLTLNDVSLCDIEWLNDIMDIHHASEAKASQLLADALDLIVNNRKRFSFSAARRALDHFKPQSSLGKEDVQGDRFGNLSLVTASDNSALGAVPGPGRYPIAEAWIERYPRKSLSFKFLIMCLEARVNGDWDDVMMRAHMERMAKVLLDG